MILRKLAVLGLALLPAASAQFVQQGGKLVGGGGGGSGCQGISTAISADGSTAIVGGNCDTGATGAAWVYTRENGAWMQQGPKLVGSGAIGYANQGYSVSLSADGNTAILGGPTDNLSGAAWIFVRLNGVWLQQAKLVATGAVGTSNQGHSVALSGDGNTAIVGGPSDGNSTGAAWMFIRSNGVWLQIGKLVGLPSSGGSPVRQGTAVALSYDGGTAVVGAPFDNDGAGAVWVFTRSGAFWIQQGKVVDTGGSGAIVRQLGTAVAVSADGNTIVAGAPGDGGIGTAVVYLRANGVWTGQGTALTGSGAVGNANQGRSVSLSADGRTAVVGGPSDNGLNGAAWVFSRANGPWQQLGVKLLGTGMVGIPSQGTSVALSGDGNTAVVGAPGDNLTGAAWVFARGGMYLSVDAPPGAFANVPFPFTVTARNASGSIVTGYTGMVHFTSSDPAAVLPPDSLLINGTGTFSAILRSAIGPGQTHTITATDTGNPSIAGTSAPIMLQSGAIARLAIDAPASVTAGVPFRINITSYDQFGNFQPPPPTLRLRFSSSDPSAILPPETQGLAPFVAILKTGGSQTITAVDAGNPGVTGTSNPIAVLVNAATNLALGKTASQSSTLAGSVSAGAASAVDGRTDGNFFNGSVTATALSSSPWWQVDLGASSPVTSVVIWNRTDCCATRLSDYWLFISDTPFAASDTPATLASRAGTWSSHQTGAAGRSVLISTGNTRGRYVRVQLGGTDYLSLAEVEVLSSPVADWNLALGRAAAQSSTLSAYSSAGAGSAVDGNTSGNFFDGSVTATDLENDPWWQVDLGVQTMIDSIVIYNRTDCCGSRLSDYYVFVSDRPFTTADTIASLQGRINTIWFHETAAPNPAVTIGYGGFQGRYVRIQAAGRTYLSLAEVQVSGIQNLAQNKAATQSSTLTGYPAAGAGAAVDGNTDGNFYNGSVTATNRDSTAWWQVDLGGSANVRGVQVWNRTDCCGSRLNDFWIFVSDIPFGPSDTPATLQNRAATRSLHIPTFPPIANPYFMFFEGDAPGRYVRVQLTGTDYLSLAEVQVWGTGRTP